MNKILESSIKSLIKCYKGLDDSGAHVIDKSAIGDDFAFSLALTQVSLGVERGEITEEEFIEMLTNSSKTEKSTEEVGESNSEAPKKTQYTQHIVTTTFVAMSALLTFSFLNKMKNDISAKEKMDTIARAKAVQIIKTMNKEGE